MDDNKLTGTVLAVSGNKTLVLVKGNEYYLLRNRVNDHINDTVEFRAADALPMPSYLFAIAALEEPDLDATLDRIRTKWFGDWRN